MKLRTQSITVQSLFLLVIFAGIATRPTVVCSIDCSIGCPGRKRTSYKAKRVENTSYDHKCPIEGSSSPYESNGEWWCRVSVCPDGKWHDVTYCSTGTCLFGYCCSGPCFKNDEGVSAAEMFRRINNL